MRLNEWEKREEMKEICGCGLKWEKRGREVVDRKRKQEHEVYCISETYYAQYP
jgi:hypothetical protein